MANWYDLEELEKHKKKYYSQAGEDGLIEYVFENIKPTSKYCVDIGAGNVISPNSCSNTRWFRDKGWNGIMFERRKDKNKEKIREKYCILTKKITIENINSFFYKHEVPKDIDFISIDIDGQDFYIWKTIKWNPKVVIIEFNEGLGPDEDKVMCFDSKHWKHRDNTYYYGASIYAMNRLALHKKYTLLCKVGRNLIFVKDGLIPADIKRNPNLIHPIALPESYKVPDPQKRKWMRFEEAINVIS